MVSQHAQVNPYAQTKKPRSRDQIDMEKDCPKACVQGQLVASCTDRAENGGAVDTGQRAVAKLTDFTRLTGPEES
jgi:hypothetical protein